MYFALPKSNERPSTKKTQLSNTMADDRISEIIHNLDDHWGSPPILTPNTLTHILSNQWVDHEKYSCFNYHKKGRYSDIYFNRRDDQNPRKYKNREFSQ
ncbi:uncharacterized protein B0P05DRAFT_527117 [Gilbertella persicaria]|uniref:uncharacterized protein n=1 Tax=Gilbertella persicaria TaxID=101096 RepID=UPI00222103F2|nr:uncharacterized protein B0P05DRAFT_527117 [Gilbertella persicaria]KAI8091354.1 hypothetical protein B0P05DRAFT_527117 [Gilbertella persicaria]